MHESMNEDENLISFSHERFPVSGLEQLSDEEFWSCAARLAQLTPPRVTTTEFLECTLEGSRCLIPLSELYEVVIRPQRLTLLPGCPSWMLGVTAWRSKTLPIIDFIAYLTGQHIPLESEGLFLIANHQSLPIGLSIPTIGKTVVIPSEQIQPITTCPTALLKLFTLAGAIQGEYAGAYILHLPTLLTNALRQIEMAPHHG